MEPMNLLIKPASGKCNMRCAYCFYRDVMGNREVADYGIMSLYTLACVLKETFNYASGTCTIAFQGGEPTLAGLEYFKNVVKLAAKYNTKGCHVEYALQTNGYCIDDEWAEFFGKYNFLVGISLDGFRELHDHYRRDVYGRGTFDKVMKTITLLEQYHVQYNILTVVHKETAANTYKVYNFFKRMQFKYQQYIECLDPLDKMRGNQDYSLTPEMYGQFLKKLFDKWYRDISDGQYVYIRYFDNLLMMLSGQQPESCNMRGRCGKQWVIESDGSVYPCDFYVLDKWKLGNLAMDDMASIERKRKALKFLELSERVPKDCEKCKWFRLCRNGCRRNCGAALGGIREKNYYCTAYKEFFEYAVERMLHILSLWEK